MKTSLGGLCLDVVKLLEGRGFEAGAQLAPRRDNGAGFTSTCEMEWLCVAERI